jgi:hypothetical protein
VAISNPSGARRQNAGLLDFMRYGWPNAFELIANEGEAKAAHARAGSGTQMINGIIWK